ncbi:MAG: hypothetical protein AAGI46_00055 [Planctomycetota bacterium]
MPTVPLDEAGLALRYAWLTYIAVALIPPAAMIGSIFVLLFTGNGATKEVDHVGHFWGVVWLVGGMTFIGVTLPGSFYIRRQLWNEYYAGDVVTPGNYLKGWVIIWLPLVSAGVLGFIGLALTRDFATVFISMLAFIVFLSMAPNGHAMTRPVGDHDDPATYEEPK